MDFEGRIQEIKGKGHNFIDPSSYPMEIEDIITKVWIFCHNFEADRGVVIIAYCIYCLYIRDNFSTECFFQDVINLICIYINIHFMHLKG